MSGPAKAWAEVQRRRRDLSTGAKVVLMALADRHQFSTEKNPDAGCFPQQDTIAADCGLSRSTVNVHLKALEAAGVIVRHRNNSSAGREATRYTLVGLEPMSDRSDVERVPMSDPMSEKPEPMSDPMSGQSDTNPGNPSKPSEPVSSARATAHATTIAGLKDPQIREAVTSHMNREFPESADDFHRLTLDVLGLPLGGKWTSASERAVTAGWHALLRAAPRPALRTEFPMVLALARQKREEQGTVVRTLRYFDEMLREQIVARSFHAEPKATPRKPSWQKTAEEHKRTWGCADDTPFTPPPEPPADSRAWRHELPPRPPVVEEDEEWPFVGEPPADYLRVVK